MAVNHTLLYRAAELVLASQFASAGMLQRSLHIGHPVAADLLVELEAHGIVGPGLPGRSRSVLVRADKSPEVLADFLEDDTSPGGDPS